MDNEVISALPTGGQASSPLLRNFLIKRMIYSFEPTDDPSTFNALDDETGAIPHVLAFNGSLFWFDPDDTTSDHDGAAIIATADGYRYKVDDVDYRIRSALSDTETDPPESPSLGDVYLVPAGATGAWSSHQDDIAIWTRNGWRFEVTVIGKWLLIEDADGFKRYGPSGWSYGPGARSFDDESVPLSAALGWGERIIVENQTTTTPPTATKGLRYIVGPSATGDWLGKDAQIAICEVAGSWTFYLPLNGWSAYDKAQSNTYTFNGTVWVSAAGAWVGFAQLPTTSNVQTSATIGSTSYNYSSSIIPANVQRRYDSTGLLYTAKKAGATMRVRYYFDTCSIGNFPNGAAATNCMTIGVYRDNETQPIDYAFFGDGVGSNAIRRDFEFAFQTSDALPHSYKIAFTNGFDGSRTYYVASITRRRMTIEELA